MNDIESKIYKMRPQYLIELDSLVNQYSQYGGGSEKEKYTANKSFSSVYEIYIYSFFVGLYNNKRYEPSDSDELKSFWEVESWKPRPLVDYLLACAIAESDFDMASAERIDNNELSGEIGKLKYTIESYANGGLNYIGAMLDDDPDQRGNEYFFIELLGKSGTQ